MITCLTWPSGSTTWTYRIADASLNNTRQFTGQYSGYSYIKPVGVVSGSTVYLAAYVYNNSQNAALYQNSSRYTYSTTEIKIVNGSAPPASCTYSNDIPWFTDLTAASNYSLGLPFDKTKWFAGLDVRTPDYNWSSVHSITGKDGESYRLTDILNINDGAAVNDVAYDNNLDFSAASKVNNLIADVIQDGSKVTVNYEIPEGTYQYVKLVYKLNEIPEDVNDGTAITISASSTSTEISGIATGDTYWFVIFTDVSSSEPYEFNTSELNYTNFDYTGDIQTFTAPKSGYYSLETWGAQGGSISKNGEEARGGYGAYAYGEVYLNQGDTLYVNVGGQNGYNGGGNYDIGNIKNIIIPNFNQSIALDSSLWTENWNSGLLNTGSLPSAFTLSYDFLDFLLNATVETESVLIFERNGVKIYGMRDSRNATYGGYYKYSIYIKDGDEIVAGSQYPAVYYSQAWYIASGFDKRSDYYNSNVWDRIQALYLGFGVDDDAKLGYLIGCSKWHNGYDRGSYINKDSYQSIKISNNTGEYGAYCNSAKLYDALKKMAGEST